METAGQIAENTQTTTSQDIEASFDATKNVACEVATSEDFSIPTDINFVDQCAMIRESTKTLESIKSQLPAGVNIPGY